MSKKWYYKRDGEVHGPILKQDLVALLQSGDLGREDLVRKESHSEWQPAWKFRPDSDSTQFKLPLVLEEPADRNTQTNYYCSVMGVELGPIPLHEVRDLIEQGSLLPEDKVRRSPTEHGRRADTFPELRMKFTVAAVAAGGGDDFGTSSGDFGDESQSPSQDKSTSSADEAESATSPMDTAEIKLGETAEITARIPLSTPDVTAPVEIAPVRTVTSLRPVASDANLPVEDVPSRPAIPAEPIAVPAPAPFVAPVRRGAESSAGRWQDFRDALHDVLRGYRDVRTLPLKPLAIGGGLMAAACMLVVVISSGLSFLGPSAEKYCQQAEALRNEYEILRSTGASDAEWNDYSTRALALTKQWIEELEPPHVSNPKSERGIACREVLFALRDNFPEMLKPEARRETSDAERNFNGHLEGARAVLSGNWDRSQLRP